MYIHTTSESGYLQELSYFRCRICYLDHRVHAILKAPLANYPSERYYGRWGRHIAEDRGIALSRYEYRALDCESSWITKSLQSENSHHPILDYHGKECYVLQRYRGSSARSPRSTSLLPNTIAESHLLYAIGIIGALSVVPIRHSTTSAAGASKPYTHPT